MKIFHILFSVAAALGLLACSDNDGRHMAEGTTSGGSRAGSTADGSGGNNNQSGGGNGNSNAAPIEAGSIAEILGRNLTDGAVSYLEVVQPLIADACVVCHSVNGQAPNSLVTSAELQGAMPGVLARLRDDAQPMPPNASRAIRDDIAQVLENWQGQGFPQTVQVNYDQFIDPIFQVTCTGCHSPDGSARPSLASYDEVRGAIGNVLARIRSDSNPMPPNAQVTLRSDLVRVLQDWEANGFLRSAPQQ